mmetsp:Transcript_10491/g.27890  ORF Transcript_10491/g.27890 Transcript_10491/m.27890 type:complete len:256 (+) Transcript_10491:397-1164(+)
MVIVGMHGGVPRGEDVGLDVGELVPLLYRRHHRGAVAAHARRVSLHHAQIGADRLGEVDFVYHEHVGLRHAGPALAWHLVAAGHVDDVDGEVGELVREVGREVVPTGFAQQDLRLRRHVACQLLERVQVRGDVLADRRVRAAARLDRTDAFRGQRLVAREELAILAGEDVIGHDADRVPFAQAAAQLQHERRLAGADGTADPDREGALVEVAILPLLVHAGVDAWMVVVVAMPAHPLHQRQAAEGEGATCGGPRG